MGMDGVLLLPWPQVAHLTPRLLRLCGWPRPQVSVLLKQVGLALHGCHRLRLHPQREVAPMQWATHLFLRAVQCNHHHRVAKERGATEIAKAFRSWPIAFHLHLCRNCREILMTFLERRIC